MTAVMITGVNGLVGWASTLIQGGGRPGNPEQVRVMSVPGTTRSSAVIWLNVRNRIQ